MKRDALQLKAVKRQGFVLLATILGQAVMLMTLVTYTPYLLSVLNTSSQVASRQQALAVAEAGLAHGMWEMVHNQAADLSALQNGWSDALNPNPAACDALADGLTVQSCHVLTPETLTSGDGANAAAGTYQTWVINYGQPALVRVVGRGQTTSGQSAALLASQDLITIVPGTFKYSMHGLFQTYLGHVANWIGTARTDAYDSSQGAYDVLLNRIEQGDISTGGINAQKPEGAEGSVHIFDNGEVFGQADVQSEDTVIAPAGQPSQGVSVPGFMLELPQVTVPPDLEALAVTTSIAGFQGTESGAGDFLVTGTYTCNAPVRVHQMLVADTGTLVIEDNCKMLIDSEGHTPAYELTGMGLTQWGPGTRPTRIFGTDTATVVNGSSGKMVKNSTATTAIFVREGAAEFAGEGLSYDASVAEASRLPINVQIYQTCAEATHCYVQFEQTEPFYGVVYSDAGDVYLGAGFDGDSSTDGDYFGSFFGGGEVGAVGGENGGTFDVGVHYDTTLANLALDGSGGPPSAPYRYSVKPSTWHVRSAQ